MRKTLFVIAAMIMLIASCKRDMPDPNVLFILTDQWRATAFGFAGDPNVKTPNLDKFSDEAVTFSNAVSVCPVCTPYRASLLTGRFPTSTGMFLNDAYLPSEELCLAEIYKANGYQTGYIGKWHLDGHGRMAFTPPERRQGFDYWKGLECSHDYNNMPYYEGDDPEIKYWDGYSPFAVCEDAENYIESRANDDDPFFLFVSIATPHFPHHTALQEYKDLYPLNEIEINPNVPEELHEQARIELQGYYAHCTATDKAIGELLEKVNKLGLRDKTLIAFTSDHGEIMGAHGARIKQKQVPWFESAGVPLIISYPYKNRDWAIEMSVTTPDLSATLLDLSGIEIPESFEGISFANSVTGRDEDLDKASLYMSVAPFAAVRKEYKREYRAVKTSEYTYIKSIDGPWMLFDDKNDPYQMYNLVDDKDYKDILNRLDNQLMDELSRINDDFRPGSSYILEWGYTVRPAGHIPYSNEPREPQKPERKWKPLFKGDLSDAYDKHKAWQLNDGVLTASEDASLFTSSEYENFEIDLEFKNDEGTNSGVIVYCTDREDWIPNSVEIQISDDYYYKDKGWDPTWFCGGIFGHLGPNETLVREAGEWNHMRIRCEGQKILVKLNGKISAEMDMSKWTSGDTNPDGSEIPSWLPKPFSKIPTKGYIGFQGKHGKANIYFRNIRIAKL